MKNKILKKSVTKSVNNFTERTRYKRKSGVKVSVPVHTKIKQKKVLDEIYSELI